jgi:hypothetical protein
MKHGEQLSGERGVEERPYLPQDPAGSNLDSMQDSTTCGSNFQHVDFRGYSRMAGHSLNSELWRDGRKGNVESSYHKLGVF